MIVFIIYSQSVNVTSFCDSSFDKNISFPQWNCLERQKEYYYINITELKYPNTRYEFCLFIAFGANTWSASNCVTLKTKSTGKLNYLICTYI